MLLLAYSHQLYPLPNPHSPLVDDSGAVSGIKEAQFRPETSPRLTELGCQH